MHPTVAQSASPRSPSHARSETTSVGKAVAPSVSRRINGERIVVLGWGRAILLQLAHPLVAAGVQQHSSFRGTRRARLVRLHETVRAMLGLTFGDEAEAARVTSRINAIHDRVQGNLPDACGMWPAGTRYSAHDPDLLLWVHATLLDSVPLAFQLLVGPLSAAELDAYVDEAAVGAARLGLDQTRLPRTTADVSGFLERMYASGWLTASAASRALAREVLDPPLGSVAGPLKALHYGLSVGTLPPRIRELYGLAWTQRHDRRFRRLTALFRRIRSITPDRLARFRAARQTTGRDAHR